MLLGGKKKRLRSYVRGIADQMGLKDWTLEIVVVANESMGENAGHCEVYWGRKCAQVAIAEDWPSWKPKGLRNTVVHELIHCHTAPMGIPLRSVESAVGTPAFEALSREYRHHHEIAVDGMAVAWAEKFPLP